jgi:hypothetical protein
VLFLATRIGESKVDKLDLVVLDQLHDIGCGRHRFLLALVFESGPKFPETPGLQEPCHARKTEKPLPTSISAQ